MTTTLRRAVIAGIVALPALVCAAVPAHAESGPYVALAYSPADGAAGTGTGPSEGEAMGAAMAECYQHLGTDCKVVSLATADQGYACAALTTGASPADFGIGNANTEAEAIAKAQSVVSGALLRVACATLSASAAAPGTATVLNDVDVYSLPDGVGEPLDGVFLSSGDTFSLVEPCRDNWCHLIISFAPGGTGWVYQDGFLSVS